MSEVVILPEMVEAGHEALLESREQGLDEAESAVAVFLAMSAVWELVLLRQQNATKH